MSFSKQEHSGPDFFKPNFFLKNWEPLTAAIGDTSTEYVIMDLHYEKDNMFMNEKNMPKFMTSVTRQPIIVGYNGTIKSPFMVIRYIDTKNNEKYKLRQDATSFLILYIGEIAHVGLEPIMFKYKWVTDKSGKPEMKMKTEMNVDNGTGIINYVVELIRGKLDKKKIR